MNRTKHIVTCFLLSIILSSCDWYECQATGKILYNPLQIKNGKVYQESGINYASSEIINDESPPILQLRDFMNAILLIDSSLINKIKLIDKTISDKEDSEILNNFEILNKFLIKQVEQKNIISISYKSNSSKVAKNVVNLVMKKIIERENSFYLIVIDGINKKISTLNFRIQNKAMSDSTKEAYKKTIREQQAYKLVYKQYLAELSSRNQMQGIGIEIIELANSSCSLSRNSIFK